MTGPVTAVFMGGAPPEHQVSRRSGEAVLEALAAGGYSRLLPVVIEGDGSWTVADQDNLPPARALEVIHHRQVQVCFLALHGPGGEDGSIQGLLDTVGIPYTGSGVAASALAMSKAATRALLAAHGPPLVVAPGFIADPTPAGELAERVERQLGYPCFLKEDHSGSSLGVHRLADRAGLEAVLARRSGPGRVVVERALQGPEASVGTLGNYGRLRRSVTALPPVEIIPTSGAFFDYVAKYEPGMCQENSPPRHLPPPLCARLEELACLVHRLLECDGAARTDFIIHPDLGPVVLECNTIPGLTAGSLLPKAAAAAGIDFPALVDLMVEMALEGR